MKSRIKSQTALTKGFTWQNYLLRNHKDIKYRQLTFQTSYGSPYRLYRQLLQIWSGKTDKDKLRNAQLHIYFLQSSIISELLTYNIFKSTSRQKIFSFKFQCDLFLRVQLTINKYWFRQRWTGNKPLPEPIRTTRMPAFWDTPCRPMITLPILVIHIRSQVKIRQSQSNKFSKIAKN